MLTKNNTHYNVNYKSLLEFGLSFFAISTLFIIVRFFNPIKLADEYFYLRELYNWDYVSIFRTSNINVLFLYFYFPLKALSLNLIKYLGPTIYTTILYFLYRYLLSLYGVGARLSKLVFLLFLLTPHNAIYLSGVLTIHFELIGAIAILIATHHLYQNINIKSLFMQFISMLMLNLSHIGFSLMTLLFSLYLINHYLYIKKMKNALLISLVYLSSIYVPAHYDLILEMITNKDYFQKFSYVIANYTASSAAGNLDYGHDVAQSSRPTKIKHTLNIMDKFPLRNPNASKEPLNITISNQLLQHIKVKFFDYLSYISGPLIFQTGNIMYLYISMFPIIRFIFLGMLFQQILLTENIMQKNSYKTILALYTSITLIYSCGTANYGTALRHNITSDFLLYIGFALFLHNHKVILKSPIFGSKYTVPPLTRS